MCVGRGGVGCGGVGAGMSLSRRNGGRGGRRSGAGLRGDGQRRMALPGYIGVDVGLRRFDRRLRPQPGRRRTPRSPHRGAAMATHNDRRNIMHNALAAVDAVAGQLPAARCCGGGGGCGGGAVAAAGCTAMATRRTRSEAPGGSASASRRSDGRQFDASGRRRWPNRRSGGSSGTAAASGLVGRGGASS